MLQGYFDDSGSEPQSFAFVIAGYILSAQQMSAFADDWQAVLHQNPRIECFKMSDAFLGEGEFETMASEFRKAKVRDLLAAIRRHRPRGLASFMNWEDFKVFARYLPKPLGREAFAPLFFRLIDTVLLWQKSENLFPQKVQLDFDDQGKAGEFAIEWYGRLMNGEPPLTFSGEHRAILEGTPRMLNDHQYVPLQAADMAAWVVRNAGTPGIDTSGWEWLYDGCLNTIWRHSPGFSKQSWDQLLLQMFGPPRIQLS